MIINHRSLFSNLIFDHFCLIIIFEPLQSNIIIIMILIFDHFYLIIMFDSCIFVLYVWSLFLILIFDHSYVVIIIFDHYLLIIMFDHYLLILIYWSFVFDHYYLIIIFDHYFWSIEFLNRFEPKRTSWFLIIIQSLIILIISLFDPYYLIIFVWSLFLIGLFLIIILHHYCFDPYFWSFLFDH